MKTNHNPTKPPQRKNRGNWSLPHTCPGCAKPGTLEERLGPSVQVIRNEEITCEVTKWVCAECAAAFMSPSQATEGVKVAVSEYQRQHGFLTADEIKAGRSRLGMSAGEFAEKAQIGEATIKRIEAGTTAQNAGTNKLIAQILPKEISNLDYHITLDGLDLGDFWKDDIFAWGKDMSWNSPTSLTQPKTGSSQKAVYEDLALAA